MSNGCAETNEMELAQKGFINLDFCVRLSTAILQMLTPTTVSIIRDRNEGNHYLEIRSTSSRAVSLYLIIKVRKPDLGANLNGGRSCYELSSLCECPARDVGATRY